MPESAGQFVCDQIARQAEEQAQAASTSIDSELTQPATSSSSKLLARLRRTRRNAKISTNGSFRSKDSSDPTVCNDELVWRDNTLTWARGCKLIRTFQFEQPVFQAFWASMEVDSPDQLESPPSQSQPGSSVSQHATATSSPTILKERGPFSAMQRNLRNFAHVLTPSDLRNRRSSSLRVYERALCVCFEMGLFIHLAHRGEQYNIDLPFRLAKAFPLPVGLILQRQTETEDVEIADRIEKHYRSYRNDPDSSSFDAYPFPSVPEPDSQLKTPEMLQVPLDVGSLEEEEQHLASTILPMAFHLRRPFDELAQVDRYPQLSHSLSGEDNTDDYLLHGPSSPFTQVDEKICFVSPSGSDKSGFCLLITASHRSRSIRLYSAATQPTRPQSTPVILSSRLSSNKVSLLAQSSDPQAAPSSSAGGSSRDPFPTADLDDASQAPLSSGGPLHRRKSSGNGLHSLGRGAPSTRKSGRIDLERRQSSMGSTMGRDASGRSRRISAMHAGNAERRLVGRGDDTLPSGRDRVPTGNMSQTVDGLRRQSQNYAQESMLDDLAGANTSMLMTGSLQPGTRLRRTSHAARGIYTAPRASSRPSAAMARVRSSMSMTRGDSTSMEADFDMTAFGAPNRTGLSLYEHETMEPNDPSVAVGHLDDPQTLTDLDDFARGFAAVSLLEEIKVDELQQPDLVDQIHAFLAPHSRGIELVYISVPATGKTFCRLISTRTYPAESQVLRTCLTSRLPDAKMASSSIPSAMIASVRTMGSIGTEIISVRDDGSLELSFGTIAASAHSLQLGPWARWARSKSGDDSSTSTDKVTSVKASRSNGILITTEMSKSPIELDLDFRPRCQLTSKVLKSLALVLDPDRYQELRAAWVRRRFGLDNPIGQRDVLLFDHDWVVLTALLAKEKARNHDIQPWSGIFSDLTRSVSHFHYADESLLDGIKTFQAERAPSTPRSPTPLAQELTTDETAAVAAMLHLLAQDARLDTVDARNEVAKLSELLMQLASSCKDSTMLDYWARLRPQANPSLHLSRGSSLSLLTRNSEPPFDIYDVLMSQLNGKRRETVASLFKRLHNRSPSTESFEDELNKVCHRSYQLLELFASQSSSSASVNSSISTSRAHQMVTRMTALGLEADRIRRLPFGLALPLLEAIRTCQIDPPIGWKPDAYLTVHRADLALLAMPSSSGHSMNLSHPVSKSFLKTLPRNVAMDPLSAQIFSKDFRLAEVAKMLQTTESNTVYVAEGEGLSESAVVELHNRAVMGLAERTKAIPVGRGMLLMASKPFQVTRKWDIPRLCLSVKVIPRGTTIKPESKPESAAQEWPEFHNGVASILEISVPANARIDSKWIFSHLGEEPTAKHAGFLFGLGLTKHLPALTPVHVFRYLRTRHNLLTIGFLLGLAAASVGTGDPAARHLLGMQLVAFLPSGSAPLNLSVITQTAGLLAMGIVFLGSNHRWTAKRLLQQIGAVESPIPDIQPQHREAYSLSAGMALGLVMLGKGRQDGMSSVPDKRILARLEELVNGKQGRLVRPKASADFRQTQADEELSLTSIPASVALALIFLRSNRKDIAELLALPKADAELNFVRPDVLLIRVLARYLILWDQIEPTEVWIHSVLPEWMRALGKSKSGLSEAAQLAHINIRAGACFAIGLKHAGSHDTKARACLMEQLIALSQDAKVKPMSYFTKIRHSATRDAVDLIKVSLAMVMSGSGDVEILRMLRMAHGEVEAGTTYGSHMATHMALGLLFLGGGRLTVGSSDSAIAVLLIALFPRFPSTASDNRSHLQAFRHLWALAVEPRMMIAKDVETSEAAIVPVRLTTEVASNHWKGRIFTPALLPAFDSLQRIYTDTARYWPAALEVSQSESHARMLLNSRILYVQRKTGYLPYSDDPQGSRSIFSRSLGTAPLDLDWSASPAVGAGSDELSELVHSYARGGQYVELVARLCLDEEASELKAFLRTVVMECLTLDKPFVLPVYLALALSSSESEAGPDLVFADTFYRSFDAARPHLIQHGLITCRLVEARRTARRTDISAYLNGQPVTQDVASALNLLRVPCIAELAGLRELVQRTVAGREDVHALRPMLAMVLRLATGESSDTWLDTFLDTVVR